MQRSIIKAVFFDVGQTLVHPAPDGASFAATARRMGFEIAIEDVLAHTPAMYARYEEHYRRDAGFWDDQERARAVWLDAYTLLYDRLGLGEAAAEAARRAYDFYFNPGAWFLYDDVEEALETLAGRGLKLGLVSNWDGSLQAVVDDLGISRHLDFVISSTDVGQHKPDPAIFATALRRVGVRPEEALHVGDHPEADVEGALAAGLHAVLIDRDKLRPGFQHDRARRIEGLAELVILLDEWA